MGRLYCHSRNKIGSLWLDILKGPVSRLTSLFKQVPRDWGNSFVISRVRFIEHLHLTNFRENYQNVRYTVKTRV